MTFSLLGRCARTGQPGAILQLAELEGNKDIDRILYKGELNYQSLRDNIREGLLQSLQARRTAGAE